jgi:hypothetical protein
MFSFGLGKQYPVEIGGNAESGDKGGTGNAEGQIRRVLFSQSTSARENPGKLNLRSPTAHGFDVHRQEIFALTKDNPKGFGFCCEMLLASRVS